MLSKAASRAWQMLIEDSNRPAEEIRLATGVLIMRPSYLPVQYEHCPYCGGIMNIWGHCMDCQFHDDPTEWWRDE